MATTTDVKAAAHISDTDLKGFAAASKSAAASELNGPTDGSAESREAFLATFSPEDDRRIMRKVDRRFLWLIGMMYILKNIDYQNAAYAKVLQPKQPSNILVELKMTTEQYNWVQSIYFISYIVFEVPSNLLLKRLTPRNWQSRIIITWGVVLACHAAVQNRAGLYAVRFFLGMMEAGMFPGLAAQLCGWYRTDEMGKPIMWMFGFQNCSGIIGALIAYGVSYMDGVAGLSAWRWLYLLEGIYTILFSVVVFFVLPDWPQSPRSDKWLTKREQDYISARLTENAPQTKDASFDKSEVWASLKDPRTYSFMLSQILCNFSGYALSWQLPTITTNLGFAGLPRNQLLNIPPSAAAVLSIIFAGWFLKHAWITRPAFIMIIMTGSVISFALLAGLKSNAGVYAALVLGTMFYSVYFIPFWAWRSSTLKGTTGAAFTLAFQSCVGQVGGVVGPQLFQSKFAYNGYRTPFIVCAAVMGLAFIANLWTWWLTRNVEWDVRRIRRQRIKAKKEGKIFAADDVKVYDERHFYNGVKKVDV